MTNATRDFWRVMRLAMAIGIALFSSYERGRSDMANDVYCKTKTNPDPEMCALDRNFTWAPTRCDESENCA